MTAILTGEAERTSASCFFAVSCHSRFKWRDWQIGFKSSVIGIGCLRGIGGSILRSHLEKKSCNQLVMPDIGLWGDWRLGDLVLTGQPHPGLQGLEEELRAMW